jgi:hypothetical protein
MIGTVTRSTKRGAGLPPGPATARVSVVVPCYNYGGYLEGCVGSALSQEGVHVDVLIIDDASPDGSVDIARGIAERDERVRVLAHERNCGHIATYNEGLALCRGDYTVLLSADDLLAPGALARATAVFARYPNVGFVYGRTVYFTETPLPAPSTRTGQHVVWGGIEWARSRCEMGRGGIVSPEVVVRTELQQEVGGYRLELPHSGDTEMWLRFALRADVAYVDADHAYYRMHATSMSKSQFSTALADARERTRAYVSAFEDAPAAVASEAARLHELAMRGIAREILWGVCRAYDRGEADEGTVGQLVDFASEIYPGTQRLGEYRRLRLRRASAGLAPRLALLWFPDLAVHRIRLLQRSFAGNWWWHLRS